MAFTLTRNRAIVGAGALITATLTAVMLTLPSGITLPPAASAVIGPQAPIGNTWFDNTEIERARVHASVCTDPPPGDPAGLDHFTMTQYYGLPLTLYIAASRANDSELLDLARKCADSWWKHPTWIGEGKIRKWPDEVAPPPRHAGIEGLILRALDGRPEMWPWIVSYTQFSLDHWVKKRVNDQQLFYGVREGAFSLQYAVLVVVTLPADYPDAANIRARLLADIEDVTVNYYGRLQQSDGSWRWDDVDYTDSDGGTLKGVMQPFMVGLLLNTLADVHGVSGNSTVRSSVVTQITRACRHLYLDGPYTKQLVKSLNKNVRGFHYFYHGGTTVNPTKYEKGDLPADWDTGNTGDIQNQRQPIGPLIAAYGFAFQATGDVFFKQAGDELWDSAYGPTDGIHNYAAGDGKSYNQNYRSAGRYLVWGAVSTGSPSPTPSASLSPTTESPNNTRIPTAVEIVDSARDKWTKQSNGNILRNGQNTSGVGSVVLYCQRNVYAFGTDSQWYKWAGGWGAIGVVDPCGGGSPSPTPTATVAPLPTPSPTLQPPPSPTVTPRPSPTPTPVLPVCKPNQIVGDPAVCLCITGIKNNCRCR